MNVKEFVKGKKPEENIRICRICKEIKLINNFYIRESGNPRTECIKCLIASSRKRYSRNKKQRIIKVGVWKHNNLGKVRAYAKDWYTRNKDLKADYQRKYEAENRIKRNAHHAVLRAKKKGILIPKPCIECGNKKVQAHHYLGYEGEHWKDVLWLCSIHHAEYEGRTNN